MSNHTPSGMSPLPTREYALTQEVAALKDEVARLREVLTCIANRGEHLEVYRIAQRALAEGDAS